MLNSAYTCTCTCTCVSQLHVFFNYGVSMKMSHLWANVKSHPKNKNFYAMKFNVFFKGDLPRKFGPFSSKSQKSDFGPILNLKPLSMPLNAQVVQKLLKRVKNSLFLGAPLKNSIVYLPSKLVLRCKL